MAAEAKTVQSLRAQVVYDRIQGLVQDRQRRFGTFWYQSGPPTRLAVRFERLLVDETVREQARHYIFDGSWFVERIPRRKRLIKRRIAPKGAEGAPGFGDSPLPVPSDLNADKLLRHYRPRVAGHHEAKGQQAERVHLVLEPRAEKKDQTLKQVELWYRAGAKMPHKVATTDRSRNRSVLRLRDVETGAELPSRVFDTSPPENEDWDVEVRGSGDADG